MDSSFYRNRASLHPQVKPLSFESKIAKLKEREGFEDLIHQLFVISEIEGRLPKVI
ncbi:hypothetical protein [Leptospira ryugenii]|uniref:hypothetical protein n=1 Tax=Leptospira ryugenii TaxID=1917863 RepID=UPI001435589A|nr:hypothetical protein [Leptospira ryugenii]